MNRTERQEKLHKIASTICGEMRVLCDRVKVDPDEHLAITLKNENAADSHLVMRISLNKTQAKMYTDAAELYHIPDIDVIISRAYNIFPDNSHTYILIYLYKALRALKLSHLLDGYAIAALIISTMYSDLNHFGVTDYKIKPATVTREWLEVEFMIGGESCPITFDVRHANSQNIQGLYTTISTTLYTRLGYKLKTAWWEIISKEVNTY